MVVPSARNQEPSAWWYKTSTGWFLFRENTKNSIFRELEHYASLVCWVSPSSSCCSWNPEIFSAPVNLIHFALPSRCNPESYIHSTSNPSHALPLHLKAS